jgi:hypothetical protein
LSEFFVTTVIMAPWFTVTLQPAILSELLCILGAEGCAVDVFRRPVVQLFCNEFIN